MKPWEKYIEDDECGKIIVGKLVRQSVERWRSMERDPSIYFDDERVERCI